MNFLFYEKKETEREEYERLLKKDREIFMLKNNL